MISKKLVLNLFLAVLGLSAACGLSLVVVHRLSFSMAYEIFLECVHVCAVSSVGSNSCDPMDCSLPGSPVHGILQARIVE